MPNCAILSTQSETCVNHVKVDFVNFVTKLWTLHSLSIDLWLLPESGSGRKSCVWFTKQIYSLYRAGVSKFSLVRQVHAPSLCKIFSHTPSLNGMAHTHMYTYTHTCLLYTSPSPRDATLSRMPSSA